MPAHYVSPESHVQNSLVAGGCNIYGEVDFSVLFTGAFIGTGAVVRDSIIMPGARVEEGAVVQYAIVAEDAVIGEGAVVGARPEDIAEEDKAGWGIAVVGAGYRVKPGAVVPPKAMLDAEEAEKSETE